MSAETPHDPGREDIRPLLRGVSHVGAFWLALGATIALAIIVEAGLPRALAIVYGVGLCVLFAASGLYHRWRWDIRWRPLLRRIDHSAIFIFIAASTTPVAMLVLDGSLRWVLLVLSWLGAIVGIILSVAWIEAPPWLKASYYLVYGWLGLTAAPQLVTQLGVAPLMLLIGGAVLYTLGTIVFICRRPDPFPQIFGFHEIFHIFVIAAASMHYVAMLGWIFPH